MLFLNAYGIRALRFAQWSPALQNGCLVIIHPLHPRLHSLTALLRSGTFHHPFKVGPRSHIDREPPSTRRGNRIDGWFESLTHHIAVQLCKTLCCAPEQGTRGGLHVEAFRRAAELKRHGQAASSGSNTKPPALPGDTYSQRQERNFESFIGRHERKTRLEWRTLHATAAR